MLHTFTENTVIQIHHQLFTIVTCFGLYLSHHKNMHYLELQQKLYNYLSVKFFNSKQCMV